MTQYVGPTTTKPARIRVEAMGDRPIRRYYPCDSGESNPHMGAAKQFFEEIGWNNSGDTWHVGATKNGYVFVLETKSWEASA